MATSYYNRNRRRKLRRERDAENQAHRSRLRQQIREGRWDDPIPRRNLLGPYRNPNITNPSKGEGEEPEVMPITWMKAHGETET